jgi:hypothetical protein
MEARGFKTLNNYQNSAKAFKVKAFQIFMAEQKANKARLKSTVEFGRAEMGEGQSYINPSSMASWNSPKISIAMKS